jgi:hypothetical protein
MLQEVILLRRVKTPVNRRRDPIMKVVAIHRDPTPL